MKAFLKNIGISPKKANLVAGMVRGKMVETALTELQFTPKKGAGILYKVIASAAANATNNFKQNKSKLYIKEIVVNKGAMYKRSQPVSKGRSHPILVRRSNITVVVDVSAAGGIKAKKVKTPKTAKAVEANNPQN